MISKFTLCNEAIYWGNTQNGDFRFLYVYISDNPYVIGQQNAPWINQLHLVTLPLNWTFI